MKTWHWLLIGGVLLFLWKRHVEQQAGATPPPPEVLPLPVGGTARMTADSLFKQFGFGTAPGETAISEPSTPPHYSLRTDRRFG